MRPLIYFENADGLKRSGIGRAMRHQLTALSYNGIEACIDKNDTSYDLAHINTYFVKSKALLRKCKSKGIPVILHGHSTFEDFRNSFRAWKLARPFYEASLRYMYSRADLIIAPTEYARDLIAGYPFVTCPVEALSNGIDPEEYAPSEDFKRAFRDRFHIEEGEPFIIGVGFPFARKGLQDFFAMARQFPGVKFIWFGSLQKILTSSYMLREIKNRPGNAIMAGYCTGDVIKGAYQCATAMFFPSYEETEGIVVLEALVSKCPIVARDIGVYKGWLKDGVNAHLCNDNAGFEKVITNLISNGESPEILEAGYHTASERSLHKIGARMIEIYNGLLQG